MDPNLRAILAGQQRDIGYSEDYLENSREYHERQRAKAERQRQRARGADHRGINIHHWDMNNVEQHISQPERPTSQQGLFPAQEDARSDLEARRRAAFAQTLGDARVHLDRRRSRSFPADAHFAPSGILPERDAAASVQLPLGTQEVRLSEEVQHMKDLRHQMDTLSSRMQTIIDRHPEVTSAAAAERLSRPQPLGPPRSAGHGFGGPAFRPFWPVASTASASPPSRAIPSQSRVCGSPSAGPCPYSPRSPPGLSWGSDLRSTKPSCYGPQHSAARPAGLPPGHSYAPTGYAAPPPSQSQYGGGSGYATGYVGPAAGHSGSFHSRGGFGYHASPPPVQFLGVYGDCFDFSGFSDGFVPVQPAKPLLIDDFLSVSAISAAKTASHKVLVDSTCGSIVLQPADLTGLNYKKVKCPDIPSWMAAADRIKWALVNSEAIRGMDYDAYVRRCLQLMMDPKCGGSGWPLAIFLEFDNAHRID
jgi:hypothetical protein